MGIKLFKTYRKVRHIFVRPSLRFFFGKWRNDPNLPIWRKKGIWYFKIFNLDVCSKYKYGEIVYEFPPQFTIVFFGLSFTITAHVPKTSEENATFIYDDLYWEAILNAAYAPKGVDNLEHAILEGGEYVWKNYSYWSVRPSFIRKSYRSKYDLIMNKIREERTIKIKNRYNDTIVLRNIEECKYILENTDYYRVIYDPETDEIKAVDPSGGPFLTVGFKIPNTNKEIVNIEGKSKDKPIFIII